MTETDQSRRVFILGAGFSRSAGFPLATELTDELLSAIEESLGSDYEFLAYANQIKRLHAWLIGTRRSASKAIAPLNIEEFYEYAYAYSERFRLEQHRETVGRNAGDTEYSRAEIIGSALSYLDEQLLEVLLRHEEAANPTSIDRFVSTLRPCDTVVTFNYDRLVERSLEKLGISWSFGMSDDRPGDVRVLKMHGSLDWICFARDQARRQKLLRRLFSKTDVNQAPDETQRVRSGEDEYDYELFQIRDDAKLRDYIQKQMLIQRDYRWGLAGLGPQKRASRVPGLGLVWERARRALYHAEHIVVVGFSFSPFDRLAQIEFARVAAGRHEDGQSAPRVTVIDPALISDGSKLSESGNCLIQRIEAVFCKAIPIGVKHQDFDWQTLG